jgi:hypothetical protein
MPEESQLQVESETQNGQAENPSVTELTATVDFDLNLIHPFHGDHPCGALRLLFFRSAP